MPSWLGQSWKFKIELTKHPGTPILPVPVHALVLCPSAVARGALGVRKRIAGAVRASGIAAASNSTRDATQTVTRELAFHPGSGSGSAHECQPKSPRSRAGCKWNVTGWTDDFPRDQGVCARPFTGRDQPMLPAPPAGLNVYGGAIQRGGSAPVRSRRTGSARLVMPLLAGAMDREKFSIRIARGAPGSTQKSL